VHHYLRARGGVWYICWTGPDGRPHRTSTRLRDRTEAEKSLARHVLAHDRPAEQDPRQLTVEAVLARYWHIHGRTRFAKDTIKTVIGLVADELPLLAVAELGVRRQEELRDKLVAGGRSLSTVRRYFTVIWTALEWAVKRHELREYPSRIRFELPPAVGARPLTVDEMGAVLEAAVEERERRWALLYIATLARPGSLLELDWERIDFQANTIDLRVPERRETKKRRAVVPMAPTLAAWLAPQVGTGAVIRCYGKRMADFRSMWARLRERAGLPAGTEAYGVRKGVATWLRRQGISDWDIKGLLGHKATSGVTDVYATYRPEDMQQAVAAIERLLGLVSPSWLATSLPVRWERAPKRMISGGRDRDRTCDPFHVKEVLYR